MQIKIPAIEDLNNLMYNMFRFVAIVEAISISPNLLSINKLTKYHLCYMRPIGAGMGAIIGIHLGFWNIEV